MAKKRRRKKKTKKEPQIKSRLEMSGSEYDALVSKAGRLLGDYLCSDAGSGISERSRSIVSEAVLDEFRYRMATDETVFDKVNRFVNGRAASAPEEKSAFLFELSRDLIARGRIREVIAERYPDVYRLPENRGGRKRLFKTLSGSYR